MAHHFSKSASKVTHLVDRRGGGDNRAVRHEAVEIIGMT